MPGFDGAAAITALGQLAKTIPGIEDVKVGAPESLLTRTSIYVTFGRDTTEVRSTQLYRRSLDLVVIAGYVVQGAEADAELLVGVVGDELVGRVLSNRIGAVSGTYQGGSINVTPMLGGTVESMDQPVQVETPEYVVFAGQEARIKAWVVTVYQSESIG